MHWLIVAALLLPGLALGQSGAARRPHRRGGEQGRDHPLGAERRRRHGRAPAAAARNARAASRGARAPDARAADRRQGAAPAGTRYRHSHRRAAAGSRGAAHRGEQQAHPGGLPPGAGARRGTFRRLAPGPARADHGVPAARARRGREDPGERQRGGSLPRGDEGESRARRVQRLAHPGAGSGAVQSGTHRGGARAGAEGACRSAPRASISRGSRRPIPTRRMRWKAAQSAGGRTSGCPSFSRAPSRA